MLCAVIRPVSPAAGPPATAGSCSRHSSSIVAVTRLGQVGGKADLGDAGGIAAQARRRDHHELGRGEPRVGLDAAAELLAAHVGQRAVDQRDPGPARPSPSRLARAPRAPRHPRRQPCAATAQLSVCCKVMARVVGSGSTISRRSPAIPAGAAPALRPATAAAFSSTHLDLEARCPRPRASWRRTSPPIRPARRLQMREAEAAAAIEPADRGVGLGIGA